MLGLVSSLSEDVRRSDEGVLSMEEPERKYNLVGCLIISLMGAIVGALGISGLIYPVFVYLIELLPGGPWISSDASTIICRGAMVLLPLLVLVMGFLLTRPRFGKQHR
jgi:hypothetical protein